MALTFSALFAQQTTVALLNHEGTISTFYGSEALVQAHKAAAHGDVITLSGGAFTAPSSWTKAVTLRGAGCYAGADNSREVTYIGNAFSLAVPVEIETTMTIEGIYFKSNFVFSTKIRNTTLIKCYFETVTNTCGNTSFYNCVIKECLEFYATADNMANINIVNCYVEDFLNTSPYVSIKLTNCVIMITTNTRRGSSSGTLSFTLESLQYASYKNCIILGNKKLSNNHNYNALIGC